MKLAREIAEELFPPIAGQKWSEGRKKLRNGATDRFEKIIAAKLEPVRDALESLIKYAKLEGKPCSATSILALLSEEEKKDVRLL